MQARHYVISGKVQGVYYRKASKMKADQLKLLGWVRNLEDGRVEAYAMGEQEQLQIFEDFLHQGPANARVTEVMVENALPQAYDSFEIME